MKYVLMAVVLVAAGFGAWRFVAPGMMQHPVAGSAAPVPAAGGAAAEGEMTARKLLELHKADPKAFDAYVRAHINDGQPRRGEAEATATASGKGQTLSLNEYVKAGGSTDPQSIAALLASRVEEEEHTEMDKLLNLLAHGKYE